MNIGVIGVGRLGTALAGALQRAGHTLAGVADSEGSGLDVRARGLLPETRVMSSTELTRSAELVFVTVPDTAIARVASSLTWRAGQRVVHCSGALGADALADARAAGALCGCFHPLQTFPERVADASRFRGVAIGVDADAPLDAELDALCAELGARAFSLRGVDRARYHAAAVFASNFVVALHAAAAQAWTDAGLPHELARGALAPLTAASAAALARAPLASALTGPIARGDATTVARHLDALRDAPALHALYVQLSARLLELPPPIPEPALDTLQALLAAELDR
jgi:predicted short-subunit dehydrogenase-like oxidoreductase (DUF2520 family)